MQINYYFIVPLIAPVLLYFLAVFFFLKSQKPSRLLVEGLGWLGIFTAIIGAVLTFQFGSSESLLLGWADLGFSLRMDPLSMTMLVMIALLGFIILKYSLNYMDGDSRQHIFIGRLATTIASVELLVLSGNLGQLLIFWVITSICLHYLLVFYRNRPQAIAAARKKFIVARLGDISLLFATILLYLEFNTGNLEQIFQQAAVITSLSDYLSAATVLLVIAAVLKSAQFPTHGWLIEVVETPTPVSALLHAGLLNAGPFLMVRMAYLMQLSEPASLLLIGIAGLTAMIASVVYLTQPTVKVSLGYSSIAHMGFSLLMCGFGVYSAALLHLVAHSFYKANSFLSSGSVVDNVKSKRVTVPSRIGSVPRIFASVFFALAVYVVFCYIWGISPESDFTLMATGAIIVMGLAQLTVQTMDSSGSFKGILITGGLSLLVALSFFSLEKGAHYLLSGEIPISYEPTWNIKAMTLGMFALYGVVVMIQLISPKLKKQSIGYNLGIHLRNGLYANVIFDRMIGALKKDKFKWANLTVAPEKKHELLEDYATENSTVIYNSQSVSN